MELFVIKHISKVISFRLMILHTQYFPMSVFICVSLLVSFRSRWFHLQTSEMVLFLTVTIANVLLYWAMVLHAVSSYEFLVFFLCQFIAEAILFQVFPACYRWFQLIPGSSSLFQLVPCLSMYILFSPEQINLVLFCYGQDVYQKNQMGTRLGKWIRGYSTREEGGKSRLFC